MFNLQIKLNEKFLFEYIFLSMEFLFLYFFPDFGFVLFSFQYLIFIDFIYYIWKNDLKQDINSQGIIILNLIFSFLLTNLSYGGK